MGADGGHATVLAHNLQPTECAPYYVSPNGHQIAYQQADGGLWTVSIDGGEPTELNDRQVGSVSWFPDSSGVVYTLNDDVYAQWLDTSQPPQALAVGGRHYLFPTWSPDGKYIAFLETTADTHIFNVILIRSDGTGWRTLGTTAPQSSERRPCPDMIAWSPDSTRFLVDIGEPAFVFYVAGGSPVQLGTGVMPIHHAWSSDGRNLTYQDKAGCLWAVKADASNPGQLTDFPARQAVWSPRTGQIAYIAKHGDDYALEVADTKTGKIHAVTGSDSYVESNPRWAPDGAFLVFVRRTAQGQEAGIWRVPADGFAPPQRLTLTGTTIQVFAIR
jgi:Tol biopolymer transport system component